MRIMDMLGRRGLIQLVLKYQITTVKGGVASRQADTIETGVFIFTNLVCDRRPHLQAMERVGGQSDDAGGSPAIWKGISDAVLLSHTTFTHE